MTIRNMLTGTRNRTPVTMDVNAVPPPSRDQMFPQRPMTIVPNAETTAMWSVTKSVTALVVAYEAQEKRIITGSWTLRIRWRFASEEHAA